jgi:hypothetical protein
MTVWPTKSLARRETQAFMLRTVDVMLGYLDQSYNLSLGNPNQQEYNIHPFQVGLAMEALITYYELDLAEGNTPDARIPLEIKKTWTGGRLPNIFLPPIPCLRRL